MDAPFTCTSESVDLTEELDDALLDELAELCCFALESEGATGAWEVSIVLTSDEHLTRLHDDFMGIPEPTDIMTFPSDDVPGGDVVISVAQADRQRHDDAWDLPSELRFLVTHGALHLADWDDATVEDRARMLDRQRAILAAFQSRDSSSNR